MENIRIRILSQSTSPKPDGLNKLMRTTPARGIVCLELGIFAELQYRFNQGHVIFRYDKVRY